MAESPSWQSKFSSKAHAMTTGISTQAANLKSASAATWTSVKEKDYSEWAHNKFDAVKETRPSDCGNWFQRKWKGFKTFMRRPSVYPYILLNIILLLLNADQNLIPPNLSQIAREFNLSNIERDTIIAGQVNLVFFAVGAVTTLIVGYYTDRVVRRDLFVAVVMIGELGCFCTIFVTDLAGFFVTRAITGISIGGVGFICCCRG
jgi:hypothetical protein